MINKNFRIRGPYHKVVTKTRHLKMNYGLTLEQFNNLVIKQESKCKICGKVKGSFGIRGLLVDHNHYTGEVRGLLCNRCNLGLGMLREDVNLFERALKYLRGELV